MIQSCQIMKRLYNIRETYIEMLYFLGLFLVLLPSFNIFSSSFTTYRLSIVCFLILLVSFLILKRKITFNTYFAIFLLLLFISQSLSILTTQNVEAFLNSYKNVLFSVIFVTVSIFTVNKKNTITILKLLFYATWISILLRFLIFFDPVFFKKIGEIIIHPSSMDIITMNIARGRLYIDGYEEAILPISLYFISKREKLKTNLILIVGIAVISFLSGFRTKIVTLFLGLLLPFIFIRKFRKTIFLATIILFLIFIFLYYVTSITQYSSIIDRIDSKAYDISSGRIETWQEGLKIGFSSPLFGVGLGNYYDHLPLSMQKISTLSSSKTLQFSLAAPDPHNVFISLFAETGLIGLSMYIILLGYFIKKDVSLFQENQDKKVHIIIISFWVLFSFSLLNPSTSVTYLALFWVFRIMIEKNI